MYKLSLFSYINRSCVCRIARVQMATETVRFHFQRSRCLTSHCKNQKLLTAFIVINVSRTTGPVLLNHKTWMSCSHLIMPAECVQYGIHGTLQFVPRLYFANSKSRRPSWSSAYVALLASLSYSDALETGIFSQSKMQAHGYPQILQSHLLLKNCAIQTEKSNKILASATLYKPWIWSNLLESGSISKSSEKLCLSDQLTVVSLTSQLLKRL